MGDKGKRVSSVVTIRRSRTGKRMWCRRREVALRVCNMALLWQASRVRRVFLGFRHRKMLQACMGCCRSAQMSGLRPVPPPIGQSCTATRYLRSAPHHSSKLERMVRNLLSPFAQTVGPRYQSGKAVQEPPAGIRGVRIRTPCRPPERRLFLPDSPSAFP